MATISLAVMRTGPEASLARPGRGGSEQKVIRLLCHAPRIVQERKAGFRERHAATAADEKREAGGCLQFVDVPADGRWLRRSVSAAARSVPVSATARKVLMRFQSMVFKFV